MASRKPVIHARDHEHGGADPVHISWEDVATVPPSGGGGTTTGSPAQGTITSGTDADLIITLPSFVAGDLMFLNCGSWDNGTFTYGLATPTGYTALYTPPSGGDPRRGPWLYYRIMDGSEGPTVTIHGSGYSSGENSSKGCVAWGWHVAGATQAIDGSAVTTNGSFTGATQLVTGGPVTTTQANELVLAFGWCRDNGGGSTLASTVTAPVIEQYDIQVMGAGADNKTWLGLATNVQAAAGSASVPVTVGHPDASVTKTWRYATVGIKT